MRTTPISVEIGLEVHDLDLRQPLPAALLDDLQGLLADRGVLVFPGQELEPAGHLAFARQFGEIKHPPGYFPSLAEEGHREIGVLSTENGLGNRVDTWHADVTWSPQPPKYSILNMRVVPPAGGDTMWASQIAAYERLSAPMQALVNELTAEHGIASETAVHPVVHRHPLTGRKALSVNPTFTRRIVELEPIESDAVLGLLYALTTKPEGTCRWCWHEGDVAIWDNHFVMHYVVTDYGDQPRTIHRVEIEGEALLGLSDATSSTEAAPEGSSG